MAQKELPITLEEQIDMMKKYVSFRQRIRMRRFLLHAGYFRASSLANRKIKACVEIINSVYVYLLNCVEAEI